MRNILVLMLLSVILTSQPMERTKSEIEKTSYLHMLPYEVLNCIVLPYLEHEHYRILEHTKPLELIVGYSDSQKERAALLTDDFALQNLLSMTAGYVMPAPLKNKIIYLCKYYCANNKSATSASITIIDRQAKLANLEKDICKETIAVAVTETGKFYAACQLNCQKCDNFNDEPRPNTYVIKLCNTANNFEKVLKVISLEEKHRHITYKPVMAFFNDSSILMVQLPNGKIYLFDVAIEITGSRKKKYIDFNDFLKRIKDCSEFIKGTDNKK